MGIFDAAPFYLYSPFTPQQVAEKLRTISIPTLRGYKNKWVNLPGAYMGYVSPNFFELWRMSHFRNIFRPSVRGTISPCKQGSLLQVTHRAHPSTILLVLAGSYFLIHFFLGVKTSFHFWGEWLHFISVAGIGAGVILTFCVLSFQREIKLSRAFFGRLLDATEPNLPLTQKDDGQAPTFTGPKEKTNENSNL